MDNKVTNPNHKLQPVLDPISNHGPDYYTKYEIEPAVFLIKNEIPFAEGCIIKYVCRWKDKNKLEDLRKAKHYLDMLISNSVAGKAK